MLFRGASFIVHWSTMAVCSVQAVPQSYTPFSLGHWAFAVLVRTRLSASAVLAVSMIQRCSTERRPAFEFLLPTTLFRELALCNAYGCLSQCSRDVGGGGVRVGVFRLGILYERQPRGTSICVEMDAYDVMSCRAYFARSSGAYANWLHGDSVNTDYKRFVLSLLNSDKIVPYCDCNGKQELWTGSCDKLLCASTWVSGHYYLLCGHTQSCIFNKA